MAALERLTSGSLVRGVAPDGPSEVVNVKWFGDSAIELTFKTPTTGHVGTRLLYRDDEIPAGGTRARASMVLRRGRPPLPARLRSPADPVGPPLRPGTRRSHLRCGPFTSPDHGSLRINADPSTAAFFYLPMTREPVRRSWPVCLLKNS